jgi:hypothetical protein
VLFQAAPNMGLTQEQVAEIEQATAAAWTAMLDALIPAKGYNWQAFSAQDGTSPSVSQGRSSYRLFVVANTTLSFFFRRQLCFPHGFLLH